MTQPQEVVLTTQTMGKKHLPQPRGPHSVGFVDVLTSGDAGVLVRIYYPTKVSFYVIIFILYCNRNLYI